MFIFSSHPCSDKVINELKIKTKGVSPDDITTLFFFDDNLVASVAITSSASTPGTCRTVMPSDLIKSINDSFLVMIENF